MPQWRVQGNRGAEEALHNVTLVSSVKTCCFLARYVPLS